MDEAAQRLVPEDALPGAEERARQYAAAGERLVAAGYRRIGIDHFARPDDPLAQAAEAGALHRNFQGYTTDAASLLLGFGASAIGSLPQGYVQNETAVARWRERVAAGDFATSRGVALSDEDRLRHTIIERLMCALEVDLAAECRRHGVHPEHLAEERDAINALAQDGLGWCDGWRIGIEERNRPLVRVLCTVFDQYFRENAGRHSRGI